MGHVGVGLSAERDGRLVEVMADRLSAETGTPRWVTQ
jgi:hypothetical protein